MVRETLETGLELTFKSSEVEGGTGRPSAVRTFAADVAAVVEAVGDTLRVKQVNFARSVTFILVPAERDEALPHLAGRDDDEVLGEDAPELAQLEGVRTVIELASVFALPADDALPAAVAIRPALAQAYVRLARTLKDKHASMEVAAPLIEDAHVSEEKATRLVEVADEPIRLPPDEITVNGRLIAADANTLHFRVKLAEDYPRPEYMAPQTKYVEGVYADPAKLAVEKHSLWNSEVSADLIVSLAQYPDRLYPTMTGVTFVRMRPGN